jgi:antitoxin (DNA-binding transcriptional repressor) of toxin-antitoxin stability system
MKQATLRDLRYHFDRIATLLQDGEEIQITKRKRVVARLLPPPIPVAAPRPDFAARLKQMWGDKVMEVTGAELLAQERSSRD